MREMGTYRRGETGRGRMSQTGGQTGRERVDRQGVRLEGNNVVIFIFINVFFFLKKCK